MGILYYYACPIHLKNRKIVSNENCLWTGRHNRCMVSTIWDAYLFGVHFPYEPSCPSVGWSVRLSKFIGKLNEIILLAISNQPSLCLNHQTVASSIYEVWTGSNFNWPKIIKFFLLSFLTFIFSVMYKEKLIIYAFTLSIELYLWNQMEHVTRPRYYSNHKY